MTVSAAGSSGLPLWLVCTAAFVAILAVGLAVLLAPQARKQRAAKQVRLDEVYRYRVLGAYADQSEQVAAEVQTESALTRRALAVVDRAVRRRGKHADVLTRLERAGVRMRPEEWVALELAATVIVGTIGAFLLGPLGLLTGVAGVVGCRVYLRIKTDKRIALFEAQLPDALQLLAGALRTGFALNQAIGTVVREGTDPVSTEFGRALQEVRLGANLEEALDALAERMRSYDMTLVVMAVRTAREVGGNLAEVLQTTMVTMRERVQLRGQVKTLTAEGRISAKVLVALPILMTVYLLLFKRAYLVPLYTTGVGVALIAVGATLLVVGTFWLSRLTKIEV